MKFPVFILATFLLLVVAKVVYDLAEYQLGSSPDSVSDHWQADLAAMDGPVADSAAMEYLDTISDSAERKRLVDWVADRQWTKPDGAFFRKAIGRDQNEGVRLHALARALEIGERKQQPDLIRNVLRSALVSDHREVSRAAMVYVMEHPDPVLTGVLLALADDINNPHILLCWHALANADDDVAKAKVLELAANEALPHDLRIHAVSLLARTHDPNAAKLLDELSNSEDRDLRKAARSVLDDFARVAK